MQTVPVTEKLVQGAVSFEERDGRLRPWRLPVEQLSLYVPETSLPERAATAAGVRLRFSTDSSTVSLEVLPDEEEQPRLFDLVVDNQVVSTQELPTGQSTVTFTGIDTDRPIELYLPQARIVEMVSLGLDDGASLEVPDDNRKKWITYGSSITHCGAAHSPARTWPATAARQMNLHLTCLGYGGACHMEPLVARVIGSLEADVITMKLGINMYGGCSYSHRTFESQAIGFISLVRECHPDIPIGIISPIVSPGRESTPNASGMTLEHMREQLEDAVHRLNEYGDPNLYYFNGLDLFGEDLVETNLPDNLHPDGDGYEIIGRRAAELVLSRLRAD